MIQQRMWLKTHHRHTPPDMSVHMTTYRRLDALADGIMHAAANVTDISRPTPSTWLTYVEVVLCAF